MHKSLLFVVFCICLIGLTYIEADASVVISEIYYDHPGDDEGHEFIELYNNSPNQVDLVDWEINWAGNDFSQRSLQVSGTIPAQGYFLIGGEFTLADFGVEPDMIYNFDFQNGGSATDGVRLHNGSGYCDTILYDAPNTNMLPGDINWSTSTFAPDVSQGHSIGRKDPRMDTDEMSDFVDLETPEPFNSLTSQRRADRAIPEGNTLASLTGGLAGMTLLNRMLRP